MGDRDPRLLEKVSFKFSFAKLRLLTPKVFLVTSFEVPLHLHALNIPAS